MKNQKFLLKVKNVSKVYTCTQTLPPSYGFLKSRTSRYTLVWQTGFGYLTLLYLHLEKACSLRGKANTYQNVPAAAVAPKLAGQRGGNILTLLNRQGSAWFSASPSYHDHWAWEEPPSAQSRVCPGSGASCSAGIPTWLCCSPWRT